MTTPDEPNPPEEPKMPEEPQGPEEPQMPEEPRQPEEPQPPDVERQIELPAAPAEPLTGEVLPPAAATAASGAYEYRSATFTYESRGRPGGITLLGVLLLILGLFSLLWGLLVLTIGGLSWLTGAIFSADQMAAFGSSSALQAIVGIGGGILQVVVAVGLFGLKKWAWLLAFIAVGLSVIQGLLGIFSGAGLFGICCGAIGLIIPVWIVVYLLRKDVRAAFGR